MANRPELRHGTVDINVPPEYWATPPDPRLLPLLSKNTVEPGVVSGARKPESLRTVFIIDVSASAVTLGVLSDICSAIFESLYGIAQDDGKEETKLVSLMTFDSAMHFYNLSVSRAFLTCELCVNSRRSSRTSHNPR